MQPKQETEKPRPHWYYALVPHKLGGGMTSTLLPLFIVQVLDGSVADVGRVSSLAALISVPAAIYWGDRSDRLGRRKRFLILGFFGFALSTLLMGLTSSVAAVLILTAVGGFLSTAAGPVASALALDGSPEDRWPEAIGRLNRAGGWSFVAGMFLGTVWLDQLPAAIDNEAALRGLFILAGATALLSLPLTQLWVREPEEVRTPRRFRPALIGHLAVSVTERALFNPPRILLFVLRPGFASQVRDWLGGTLGRYFVSSFLLFLAIHTALVPLPVFYTDVLGASNPQVFILFLIKAVTDASLYVPMGRWLRGRRGGLGLLGQASGIRVVSFVLLIGLDRLALGPAGLILSGVIMLLLGVSWAAIAVSGTSAAALLAPRGSEARVIGQYNAVIGTAGIAGGFLSGYLASELGFTAAFLAGAVLAGAAGLWMWRLRRGALRAGVQPLAQ